MISKELGDIDWKKPAVEIERLIRGLNPWPSAYTHLDNKAFKIWKARVVETDGAYAPGCICKVGKNTMVVQTGEGGLELLEVQLAGKKRMDAGSFCVAIRLQRDLFYSSKTEVDLCHTFIGTVPIYWLLSVQ